MYNVGPCQYKWLLLAQTIAIRRYASATALVLCTRPCTARSQQSVRFLEGSDHRHSDPSEGLASYI
jgi:hypothetical protein